ncbi:MAG: acyl-CoA dehydrogenase family protein [Ideonella sp.]|nr:acyl-CoA dehydrogenase family protein [Ideonella sp.]MCC7458107.1 acyl-CoA dehydrogenase family protein [Nitrospira sp.]
MSQTHEVTNQVTPFGDVNLFDSDTALRDALRFNAPQLDTGALSTLGAFAGSAATIEHARLANLYTPVLHTHDRVGHRIDQVEFHPSYHVLLGGALRHGLHGTPWSRGPGAHLERAAGFIVYTQAEPSVLCPVSMSYAVTPALRANAPLYEAWRNRIAGTGYDPRFVPFDRKGAVTLGMGMTEKQGGSDVRANTSRAEPDGEDAWGPRVRITGHKWFLSAPMCDAFLVLAQGNNGLSCYFMPRWLPDGTPNVLRIQRLKDKLGNKANASSEVEFDGSTAWRVGDEGRGVPQILAMGAITRLDCALGTAGLMRQSLVLALHHCSQRHAFGKRLVEQPLMKNVLADLALESEAATALALRLARSLDASENGRDADGREALVRRVLTPIAKFWICKRGSLFAQETMECLGGNGYVEEQGEGAMARIYREMPVNSIWEGAGNIMGIDLLRALRTGPVADALMQELAPALKANAALDRLVAVLPSRVDGTDDEAGARRLARDVALAVQAALLKQHAPEAVFDAFCASRLGDQVGGGGAFGLLPAGAPLDALIARAKPRT